MDNGRVSIHLPPSISRRINPSITWNECLSGGHSEKCQFAGPMTASCTATQGQPLGGPEQPQRLDNGT
jgi:hypothetical protein